MRYRKLSPTGDMVFGFGQADFLTNSPDAVAQSVLTRLRLDLGAWFLDIRDGTNWKTGVLGNNTFSTRDAIIQARILDTPGVNSILSYSSFFDSNTRKFNVSVALDTIYGVAPTSPLASTPSVAQPPTQITQPIITFVLDDPQLGILDSNVTIG